MGMRDTFDFAGGNMASVIDKNFGSAYLNVKTVADAIDNIRYLAENMASIITLANEYQAFGANADILTTLRAPSGEQLDVLPAASDRHNKVLTFDSNGQTSLVNRVIVTVEQVVVTAPNTLAALSKNTSGDYCVVFVNGVGYAQNTGASPVSTTPGTNTVTWNAGNANLTLTPVVHQVFVLYPALAS